MKDGQLDIIQRVADKTQQLGVLYHASMVQNRQLSEQVQQLKKQLQEKNEELHELKQTYNNLKFARHIEFTSKDVHDTRLMVNKMVREIDHCIALINR